LYWDNISVFGGEERKITFILDEGNKGVRVYLSFVFESSKFYEAMFLFYFVKMGAIANMLIFLDIT
jgi:hypothetical protein